VIPPAFAIEPLAVSHDRAGFHCGVDALDLYFRQQVGQDVRKRVATCFVARELATDAVASYYTLSAGSVRLSELPPGISKRLPRYPAVPIALLRRLAVAVGFRKRGLGAVMLWHAAETARRSEVAVFALLVDAKDDASASFYRQHGFIDFRPAGRTLILRL
jgi:predicted N-acetyltransferase YhbS